MLMVAAMLAAACGSDQGEEPPSPSGPTGSSVEASEGLERAAIEPAAPVGELVVGFGDAGFDLMRAQPAEENLVFSPLSIGHALLMARGAADDETVAAIDAAFGLPDAMAAHDAWNALDAQLAAGNGAATAIDGSESPIVTVADRLWPSTSAMPDQVWIDFDGNPSRSRSRDDRCLRRRRVARADQLLGCQARRTS